MAKRARRRNATKPTTRTTVTRSRNGRTTRTTTTRSSYRPGTRGPPRARRIPTKTITNTNTYVTKTGHGGAILAIIIVLLLLGAIAYLLMNPGTAAYLTTFITPTTFAQQQGQFASQLSALQSNNQNLASFYIATAPSYHLSLNKSWSVQVTDKNATNVTVGQLTTTWNGQSDTFMTQNGIVYTGTSPTYAVTLSHSEFMSFSQTVISENTAEAAADYSAYYLTGNLNYKRVN